MRRQIRIGLRLCLDMLSGSHFRRARPCAVPARLPCQISLSQTVKVTSGSSAKLENIRLARRDLERIQIGTGQELSFWQVVGEPSAVRGYRKGRNLINGELQEDYGGGLCQLAGILYHLSLLAGLKVTERHHHSVDIYHENERYTPLGADATVVYGYKDLRIRNEYAFPVSFLIDVKDDQITAALCSATALMQNELVFQRVERGSETEVRTMRMTEHAGAELVAVSCYRRFC